MKRKLLSGLLLICLLITSLASNTFASVNNNQNDYIIVTRATGEVEKYELNLDDFIAVYTPNNSKRFITEAPGSNITQTLPCSSALFIQPNQSDYDTQANKAVKRASTRVFDWDIPGNMTYYSTTQLSLDRGDTIDYSFSTSSASSVNVGMWDNDEDEFFSAWYHGSNTSATYEETMTIAYSCDVSFAIKNLRDTSVNCDGEYTY